MSDYTSITTEDIYSCFDYGYRNRSKVSFSVAKKAFDSWLAAHDAEVREQAAQRAEAEMRLHTGHFEWLSVQDKDVLDAIRNVVAAREEDAK